MVKYQYLRYGFLVVLLIIISSVTTCRPASSPAPAPSPIPSPAPEPIPDPELAPAPVPVPKPLPAPAPILETGPAPAFADSSTDSEIAELEAEISRLELENRRLIQENQQLNNDLVTATTVLQTIRSMVNSSSYTNMISALNDIDSKANELAYFANGLPHLPPPPPGFTVSKIDDAIQKVQRLREILQVLPPPPPLAPDWWSDLDDMKDIFIDLTEWMKGLEEIPEFLESSEDLEELRLRIEGYLEEVHNTTFNTEEALQTIRDTANP
jgi:hypothetical protein